MKILVISVFLFLAAQFSVAQKISYSIPNKDDARNPAYEIIGKIKDNFLIYKNIGVNHYLIPFNKEMAAIDQIKLKDMPDKVIDVETVAYSDKGYLIYQNQKRNLVTCWAQPFDANGKLLSAPQALDTIRYENFVSEKIFKTVVSENKKHIAVLRAENKKKNMMLYVTLLDENLQVYKKKAMQLRVDKEDRKTVNDFNIDNNGNLYFIYAERGGSREPYNKIFLCRNPQSADTVSYISLGQKDIFFDELKYKIDNLNNKVLVCGLYGKSNRSNVEGVYAATYNSNRTEVENTQLFKFSDTTRNNMKRSGNLKTVFNNLYMKDIFLRKDGSFILYTELFEMQQRINAGNFNRWDFNGFNTFSGLSDFDYWTFNNSWQTNNWYWNRFNNTNNFSRYYYDNILLVSFDNTNKVKWTNILYKEQIADGGDQILSFFAYPLSGGIHILYNEINRKSNNLLSFINTGDGSLKRNINIKDGDQGYEYFIRFAKQVGPKQIIVPCSLRGYLCFALIDWS